VTGVDDSSHTCVSESRYLGYRRSKTQKVGIASSEVASYDPLRSKEGGRATKRTCGVRKSSIRDLKGVVALRAIEGEGPEGAIALVERGCVKVTSYKYLGIDIHHKLNWNYSIEKMIIGGWKAYYGLENNCKSKKLLFETRVTPIILYGCEMWGSLVNLREI
jgi:hypothetical protein